MKYAELVRAKTVEILTRSFHSITKLEREIDDGLFCSPILRHLREIDPWTEAVFADHTYEEDLDPWVYTFFRNAMEDLLSSPTADEAFEKNFQRPPLHVMDWGRHHLDAIASVRKRGGSIEERLVSIQREERAAFLSCVAGWLYSTLEERHWVEPGYPELEDPSDADYDALVFAQESLLKITHPDHDPRGWPMTSG